MNIDYDAARFWWDIFISAMLAGNILFTWLTNRTKVNTDKIDLLEQKHDSELKQINQKLGDMDARLRQAIGIDALSPIYEKVGSINTKMGQMSGEFIGMKNQLDLILHHLLEAEGKR